MEIQAVKQSIKAYDCEADVYLFGSRVDDNKKGGDIDLLIFSTKIARKEKRRIKTKLYDMLGEQKIDIVVAKDLSSPFVRIAFKEGIKL